MVPLTGCVSLSGPKKPPRCNGQHTRPLNREKWNWDNKNITLQEKIVKPVTAPIILNTLESEKATADVKPHTASLRSISPETRSDKTVELTHEK